MLKSWNRNARGAAQLGAAVEHDDAGRAPEGVASADAVAAAAAGVPAEDRGRRGAPPLARRAAGDLPRDDDEGAGRLGRGGRAAGGAADGTAVGRAAPRRPPRAGVTYAKKWASARPAAARSDRQAHAAMAAWRSSRRVTMAMSTSRGTSSKVAGAPGARGAREGGPPPAAALCAAAAASRWRAGRPGRLPRPPNRLAMVRGVVASARRAGGGRLGCGAAGGRCARAGGGRPHARPRTCRPGRRQRDAEGGARFLGGGVGGEGAWVLWWWGVESKHAPRCASRDVDSSTGRACFAPRAPPPSVSSPLTHAVVFQPPRGTHTQ